MTTDASEVAHSPRDRAHGGYATRSVAAKHPGFLQNTSIARMRSARPAICQPPGPPAGPPVRTRRTLGPVPEASPMTEGWIPGPSRHTTRKVK